METTPNPVPSAEAAPAAPAATAAPAVAAAPAVPAFKPAPGGLTCKVCNAPLKYGPEGKTSQEFVCSTLKDDSPILADKYEEWRNHWVASRVVQPK
jgi:hypothetical protein